MKIEPNSNNITFQASYPKYLQKSLIKKILSMAYNIFSIIFFPLGISRLIAHKIHVILGYFLIPSQFLSKKQIKYLDDGRKTLKNNFITKEINIKTADNVKLNGIFISGKNTFGKTISKEIPLIIHYLGNAGRYEDFGYHTQVIEELKNYNLLIVNYRGVSKSKSIVTKKGLILDAEAILEFALKRLKVTEDKIILHGHSFGGAIATEIASKHQNVKLLNDRSFSSLEKAIYHISKKIFQQLLSSCFIVPFVLFKKITSLKLINKVDNFIKKHQIIEDKKLLKPKLLQKTINIVSQILALFLSKVTIFFGWNFSPKDFWQKVKGKKFIVFLKNDKVIPYKSSFFISVKKQQNQFIQIFDKQIYHFSPLKQDTINSVLQYLC